MGRGKPFCLLDFGYSISFSFFKIQVHTQGLGPTLMFNNPQEDHSSLPQNPINPQEDHSSSLQNPIPPARLEDMDQVLLSPTLNVEQPTRESNDQNKFSE